MPIEFWCDMTHVNGGDKPNPGETCIKVMISDECPHHPGNKLELWNKGVPYGPNCSSYFLKVCPHGCFNSYQKCWDNRIKDIVCKDCQAEKCDCKEPVWDIAYKYDKTAPLDWLWGNISNPHGVTFKVASEYARDYVPKFIDKYFGPVQRLSEPMFDFTETIETWTARVRGAKKQLSLPKMREEKPCVVKSCGRMNDTGVKVCWACGNDQY